MSNELSLMYQDEVIDLWRMFCELHSELYNATCREYQLLLNSKVEDLEKELFKKQTIISKIKRVEKRRFELIHNLNSSIAEENKINNVSELVEYMQSDNVEVKYQTFLNKYNLLLIDIIEKIQAQNKKNQMFLNKAINSLREMREGVSGNKSVSTYNNKGKEVRSYPER